MEDGAELAGHCRREQVGLLIVEVRLRAQAFLLHPTVLYIIQAYFQCYCILLHLCCDPQDNMYIILFETFYNYIHLCSIFNLEYEKLYRRMKHSIDGSVVEFSPATREARVQFPVDASFRTIF